MLTSIRKEARSMLTEQETDLTVESQTGDSKARTAMFSDNTGLVLHLAKRYQHAGHSLTIDDLVQEGSIGLLKAIDHFNPSRGNFGSYAALWIKQSIRFAVYSQWGAFKVPIWTRRYINKFRKIRDALSESLNREPTPAEIGAILGISNKRTMTIRNAEACLGWRAMSENFDIEKKESINVGDIPRIKKILAWLPQDEVTLLTMRFGLDGEEPKSLSAIGKHFGFSGQTTRLIEVIIIRKVKNLLFRDKMPDPIKIPEMVVEQLTSRTQCRRWMMSFARQKRRLCIALDEIGFLYSLVLGKRYKGEPTSFEEIAKQLGRSVEDVLAIEHKGIQLLQSRYSHVTLRKAS